LLLAYIHSYFALEQMAVNHFSWALGSADLVADFRQFITGCRICLLFVTQAAHQPVTDSAYFLGIQWEILIFSQADAYRLKLAQKALAAQRLATGPQAPDYLGLVANSNLMQLDMAVKRRGQIAHQLAEVHPCVGGEEDGQMVAVEGIFRSYQLHLQPVLGHLPLGGFQCAPGLVVQLPSALEVLASSFTLQRSRRLGAAGRHLVFDVNHLANVRAFFGLGDHELARPDLQIIGLEPIKRAAAPKRQTCNLAGAALGGTAAFCAVVTGVVAVVVASLTVICGHNYL